MVSGGLGWIIVDSLDTLMIMNLTSRLQHARDWISTSLDYEKDHEVNTFETTIRMLGGLLSAHYLSNAYPDMAPLADDNEGAPGQDLYIEKATDLAGRLMGAFNSESGVPYASVNLKSLQGVASHADDGASSTSEAASLQLEFKYLAHLTGEANYWAKAEKVMKVIDDNGVQDGLVPIYIYAHSGTFRGANIRLGSRGDSYYGMTVFFGFEEVASGWVTITNDPQNISSSSIFKHPSKSLFTRTCGIRLWRACASTSSPTRKRRT